LFKFSLLKNQGIIIVDLEMLWIRTIFSEFIFTDINHIVPINSIAVFVKQVIA